MTPTYAVRFQHSASRARFDFKTTNSGSPLRHGFVWEWRLIFLERFLFISWKSPAFDCPFSWFRRQPVQKPGATTSHQQEDNGFRMDVAAWNWINFNANTRLERVKLMQNFLLRKGDSGRINLSFKFFILFKILLCCRLTNIPGNRDIEQAPSLWAEK